LFSTQKQRTNLRPPPHPPNTAPQITPTIKALVPALHISDLGTKKSKGKYKEGQSVQGRVLAVDLDSKKVTVTLKKTLLGSKLAPLADVRQAVAGLKAHGTVTGAWGFEGLGLLGLLCFPFCAITYLLPSIHQSSTLNI